MSTGNDMARMRQDLTTARRRVMGVSARAAQQVLRVAVDSGYAERVDVQGKPYLRPRDGHLPPMERTGRLRSAYRYLISEGASQWLVTVLERTPYGQYLRDGTTKMQPRQHIPKPQESLPRRWQRMLDGAIQSAVARLGGAR